MDNICLSTDSNFCETISSIETIRFQPFSIFPNPSSNILFFKNVVKSEMISIHNLTGQELFSYYLRKEDSSLNISNLPAGNYLIKIHNPNYKSIIFQKL
ncbi:MAG: T9SS type A sorting domain-containing protein [Bacteroidetes bacterium]|nr:T9SS type A sorting domain-containing protein [Bacteroidota bacterium]